MFDKLKKAFTPNVNQDTFVSQFGKMGEIGFNYLLLRSPLIWNVINQHLSFMRTNWNLKTYFQWQNNPSESFAPFDFLLNADAKFDYGVWKIIRQNESQVACMIDVKTSSFKSHHFVRSFKEIEKVDNIIKNNFNVSYMICLIMVKDPNTINIADIANWKVRFIDYRNLPLYAVKNPVQWINTNFPPTLPEMQVQRNNMLNAIKTGVIYDFT